MGYGKTLGEALISEGLADHFSMDVFDAPVPQWCKALNEDDIQKYIERASSQFINEDYNHSAWFFGDNKELQKWTGYSLGYFIAEKYLKNYPSMTAAKLVDVPAKAILEVL